MRLLLPMLQFNFKEDHCFLAFKFPHLLALSRAILLGLSLFSSNLYIHIHVYTIYTCVYVRREGTRDGCGGIYKLIAEEVLQAAVNRCEELQQLT